MSFLRRAFVYGVAAVVGYLFAILLLPRGVEESAETQGVPSVAAEAAAVTRTAATNPDAENPADEGEDAADDSEEGKIGRGGNPKAREIAEALSTPAHELVGRTSPVWVQIKRVLPEGDGLERWNAEIQAMQDLLKGAARDINLDLEEVIASQRELLRLMRGEDLGEAVGEALDELALRLNAAEDG